MGLETRAVYLAKRRNGPGRGWIRARDGLIVEASAEWQFAVGKGTGWLTTYLEKAGGKQRCVLDLHRLEEIINSLR